ncbi:hypothetical protein [Fortiea contorta]|nr:hypothetical protein [Fortiea contorta]
MKISAAQLYQQLDSQSFIRFGCKSGHSQMIQIWRSPQKLTEAGNRVLQL